MAVEEGEIESHPGAQNEITVMPSDEDYETSTEGEPASWLI